jgi:hypothetical protein
MPCVLEWALNTLAGVLPQMLQGLAAKEAEMLAQVASEEERKKETIKLQHRDALAQEERKQETMMKEGAVAISAAIEEQHAERLRALQEELEEARRRHASDLAALNAQHAAAMAEASAAAIRPLMSMC